MCDFGGQEDGGSNGGCNSGLVKLTDWYFVAGYTVSFNYKRDNNGNYNIGGLKSGLSGAHLWTSWTHENSMTSTVGDKIIFKVNAKQHYNIMLEGIGTVFTQDVKILGEYDPCTGEYKMEVK